MGERDKAEMSRSRNKKVWGDDKINERKLIVIEGGTDSYEFISSVILSGVNLLICLTISAQQDKLISQRSLECNDDALRKLILKIF